MGGHGAEVEAISAANAFLNIILHSNHRKQPATAPGDAAGAKEDECEEVELLFSSGFERVTALLGQHGLLDLLLIWLAKYKHIDVAVSAILWLAAFLLRSPANMTRLLGGGGGGGGGAQIGQPIKDLLGFVIEATALHPDSEQVPQTPVTAVFRAAAIRSRAGA